MEKWFYIKNYPMVCRAYPTEKQKQQIDQIIHGVHVCYNMILYDMIEDFVGTKEKPDKKNENKIIKNGLKVFSDGQKNRILAADRELHEKERIARLKAKKQRKRERRELQEREREIEIQKEAFVRAMKEINGGNDVPLIPLK